MSWICRLLNAGGLVVLFAAVVGCGDSGPKKFPVQGTVTLDKKLLEKGTIYFKTLQTGVVDSLEIVNGEYRGDVAEGERRVEIVSYRMKVQDLNGMKGEVQENLVPRQYNTDSKLSATITAGPNQFPFELFSK
jgi:hypothetical protein